MATIGPRSVCVGVRVRSTAGELPLECRSWASRTVISMLFVDTALTATCWNSCIVSRPKSCTL